MKPHPLTWQRWFSLASLSCLPCLALAGEAPADAPLSLENLVNMTVETASRERTQLEKAASVMTVITAEDIQRQGLKTLREVLERTVGFNVSTKAQYDIVSARGINRNMNILHLIDGHVQNMVNVYGMDQQHLFPMLDKVERIEFVRGPGSTLWGSDAAAGIIHIITKDGAQLDAAGQPAGSGRVSYDYQGRDQRQTANTLWGKRFENGNDLMLSATWTQSQAEVLPFYAIGAHGATLSPRGNGFNNWENSYEVHMKAHVQDFTLTFLNSALNPQQFPNNNGSNALNRPWRQTSATLGHQATFNNGWRLESRLWYDQIDLTGYIAATAGNVMPERGFGVEEIMRLSRPDYRLLVGGRYSQRRVGTDERLEQGKPPTTYLPAITDRTTSLFAEGDYLGFKDWTLTLGARVEHNTPRSDHPLFMPRFAAVYALDNQWTLKYLHNSGVVRPGYIYRGKDELNPQPNMANTYWQGAMKEQRTSANDLQLAYNAPDTQASVTLYHMRFDDFILSYGQQSSAPPVPVGQTWVSSVINVSQVTTRGVELEARQRLAPWATLYGNYTYTRFHLGERTQSTLLGTFSFPSTFFLPSGDLPGMPRHMFNLGVDFALRPNLSLNVHARGQAGAEMAEQNTPVTFRRYGPDAYLDFALNWRSAETKGLDASFYGRNLLNHTQLIPLVGGGQLNAVPGRAYGITVGYRF